MARPRSRYMISSEVIALYDRMKFDRADGRCECLGECGRSHRFGIHRRCPNAHGRPDNAGKAVTISVRHMNGDAKDYDEANLLAMCMTCITRHRSKVKRASEQAAILKAIEDQHEPLFDVEALMPATEIGPQL